MKTKNKGGTNTSILDILRKRRSIRKYQNRNIENEKLNKIMEAAELGPSANNQQPCRFIIVTKPEIKEQLKEAYNVEWFIQAPAIVVGCVNLKEACQRGTFGENYGKVDLSIAMQNIILVATELDIGSCWIANFNEKKVKKVLSIPNHISVIAMITLGYPDETKGPVEDRKKIQELFHQEKW